LPAAAGIFSIAPYLVPVALGEKWLAGVPLMEILAFNGGLLLMHSSICTALIAVGHPDRVVKTNAVYVVMLLSLLALLVPRLGLHGAAYAALTASTICTPVYLWQVRRTIGIPPSVFLQVVIRPVLAALAMVLTVRAIVPEWTAQMASMKALAWLIAAILIGVLTYVGAMVLLWLAAGRPDGVERVMLAEIQRRFRKGGATGQPAQT
jgi:O-antigen/teichoic acid export membrane protein